MLDTALLVGVAIFLGAWVSIDEMLLRRLVMNVGVGIVFLGWVWQSLTTRCPHCRYRVMFHAYEKYSSLDWLLRARAMRSCPKCGYDPD